METKFIDSHCHLDDEAFCGGASDIIQNFEKDGIEFVVNVGSDLISSKRSLLLAEQNSKVFCAVGCHPHEAKTYDDVFEQFLISVASNPKVVAIGEIGLDYYYDLSDRPTQQKVFEKQILLADSLKLPIVLHIRDAWKDTLEILERNKNSLKNGVLLHCFSGSKEIAELLGKKYDAYFAFGGAVTFKNFANFDAVRAVKADRLLTETDSPYMTPVPFRGTLNEPKRVSLTAAKLCEILDMDISELCRIVRKNTLRFFNKIAAIG